MTHVRYMGSERKRIAIACQGGGSHTAFTAGALRRILEKDHAIVALSGTSGGAICALLAWFGLLLGDREWARESLRSFWQDNAAHSVADRFFNSLLVGSTRLRKRVSLFEVSPYAMPTWSQEHLRTLLHRYVDFSRIPSLFDADSPHLYIGAVEVLSGTFRVFRDREITDGAIMASTALPTLFRAVHIDGGIYWDGLFSQNPPVRDLPDSSPEEIWVIQINPRTRKSEPRTVEDIHDRRDELSGNLSLEQELHFIEKFNELVHAGLVRDERYRHVSVRRLELQRELDAASKLDRDPAFLDALCAEGYAQAEAFLRAIE